MNTKMNSGSSPQSRELCLRRTIRKWLWLFIACLVLSGATAIPLRAELGFLSNLAGPNSALGDWLIRINTGLIETYEKYPFLAYGTDWLAFGHFAIAVAFIGPLRDPVRNMWVIDFGLIACLLAIPFALVMGPIRGIPFFWRLIDCSFGLVGIIPLLLCKNCVTELARLAADGSRTPLGPDRLG
jgi:hypothetical protein